MGFDLSFSEEFFSGNGEVDVYSIAPSERPTSVLQAIISLPRETQIGIARDVFNSPNPESYVDTEAFPFDVLDKVRETDYCDGLESPIEVYIDEDGDYTVTVYDEDANKCETCGEELDRDCQGKPRCPTCDGPCLCCSDGPGPMDVEDDEDLDPDNWD